METDTQEKLVWHYDVLPGPTKKALAFLSGQKWLGKSGWYLAGGTALALQSGHRRSYDLDFFTVRRDFNAETLLSNFSGESWKTELVEPGTVYGELAGAKISFVAYPSFVPKQRMLSLGSIKVLRPIDIAVMKLTAISRRGRKRDFFDVYWCAKNIEPLEDLVKRLKTQYPSVAHDYHHILKSLVYFADGESDPAPQIYFRASWPEVKKFFRSEIPAITAKIIDLD